MQKRRRLTEAIIFIMAAAAPILIGYLIIS